MKKVIEQFMKGRLKPEKPVLLAFSGGPDSLALLHLLIQYSKKHPLQFAIAHVDHSWREESVREAQEIARMAENLKVPFHLKTLDPKKLQGNLEAASREERLNFFSILCKEHGYQAVLLGHHADDVAETVLKRTLEGVSLALLAGMRPDSSINGMTIWRPLLSVPKAEILEWLEQQGLEAFDDKTNRDPKYLRARFRSQIIPYLSDEFGKNVSSGLCQISEEAGELRDYLDDRIQRYLDLIATGKSGSYIDLSEECPESPYELKYLIRHFCRECGFPISRQGLTEAVDFILNRAANKSFVCGSRESVRTLYIDRGRLFIPGKEFLSLPQITVSIESGSTTKLGDWEVKMTSLEEQPALPPTDWKSIMLEGRGEVVLPAGEYLLARPDASLAKWWADHKIPAFFRDNIPVIIEKGQVRHEFLTGKMMPIKKKIDANFIKLSLEEVSG